MFSRQSLFAFFMLIVSAVAFQAPAKIGRVASRAIATSMAPLDVIETSRALATSLPVANEVTFAAYLAVLLGTFVPVTFLIVLYSQSEARKSGAVDALAAKAAASPASKKK